MTFTLQSGNQCCKNSFIPRNLTFASSISAFAFAGNESQIVPTNMSVGHGGRSYPSVDNQLRQALSYLNGIQAKLNTYGDCCYAKLCPAKTSRASSLSVCAKSSMVSQRLAESLIFPRLTTEDLNALLAVRRFKSRSLGGDPGRHCT